MMPLAMLTALLKKNEVTVSHSPKSYMCCEYGSYVTAVMRQTLLGRHFEDVRKRKFQTLTDGNYPTIYLD